MPRARSRADRSDPPRPHARKRHWQEGGTHSCESLVSAESELGTLSFSALKLSQLHTRSGLGRSAVLRRTHSSDVPLRYPRTVPMGGVPLEYSLVTSRAHGPLREYRNSPAAAPPLLDAPRHAPPDMPRARSRADRSDPPRPHAQQQGGTHSSVRLVSAESELGTLPVSALVPRALQNRSGLGRSAVLRRTHSSDVPLRYPRTVPIGWGAP